MTVLTYVCSLTATVASWNLLNSAAKWDLTWQELFLAAHMMPWFSFFFYRSSRASASARCQICRLSLDKQINNAERKKQLATCSMSEEHREFSGPARQTLGLNAWLIGDVINPLQLRLLGLFKIGFCFYWCWSFVQLLINQVFFLGGWFVEVLGHRSSVRWSSEPGIQCIPVCSFYPDYGVSEIKTWCGKFWVRWWSDPTWKQVSNSWIKPTRCVWRQHTLWCSVNKWIKVTKLRQLFLLVLFATKV